MPVVWQKIQIPSHFLWYWIFKDLSAIFRFCQIFFSSLRFSILTYLVCIPFRKLLLAHELGFSLIFSKNSVSVVSRGLYGMPILMIIDILGVHISIGIELTYFLQIDIKVIGLWQMVSKIYIIIVCARHLVWL